MTKEELYTAIQEQGYTEPEFIADLAEDTTGTVKQLLRLMNAGQTEKAWQEIEKLHDEFVYFGVFDDDSIVCSVNDSQKSN